MNRVWHERKWAAGTSSGQGADVPPTMLECRSQMSAKTSELSSLDDQLAARAKRPWKGKKARPTMSQIVVKTSGEGKQRGMMGRVAVKSDHEGRGLGRVEGLHSWRRRRFRG
jgi:hypothetical protein